MLETAAVRAIEQLYAAVRAPQEWSPALDSVVQALGADHALVLVPGRSHTDPAFGSARMDPELARRFTPDVATSLYAPLVSTLPAGIAVSSANHVSDADMERSDFYNILLRPAGGFYSANLAHDEFGVGRSVLCLCRTRRQGAFSGQELALLQSMAPHVANVVELRRKLGIASEEAQQLIRLLDRLDFGAMLASASAELGYANQRAREIMSQGDGLSIDSGGVLRATGATERLHRVIAEIATPLNARQCSQAAQRLVLPRASGSAPLLLSMHAIAAATGPLTRYRVGIFVNEPDTKPPLDRDAVCFAFGLTAREAEIAALLADGIDLPGAAHALAIGVGTARNHLKRVFDKTGQHSQVELVALLRGYVLSQRK